MTDGELEQLETQLLLEGVYQRYGWDFRQYAPASLCRRLRYVMRAEQRATISGLQEQVLHDPACMERLLLALSVDVTGMFRDPGFFLAFRCHVVPLLRTYPFVRLWCAGCATGEEAYSLAILLQEEGCYDRCRIYATDMNEAAVRRAADGILPLASMQQYTANYQHAGGARSFSDYYTAAYDGAQLLASLRRHVVFAQHNLATDASFNEFHVILNRNVLIYFNQTLRDRVHRLLYDSLIPLGFLALGSQESLRFTPHERQYQQVAAGEQLYRKLR